MQAKPVRDLMHEGDRYVSVDDLARNLFAVSEGMAEDMSLDPVARKVASYVAERLAYAVLNANLEGI